MKKQHQLMAASVGSTAIKLSEKLEKLLLVN